MATLYPAGKSYRSGPCVHASKSLSNLKWRQVWNWIRQILHIYIYLEMEETEARQGASFLTQNEWLMEVFILERSWTSKQVLSTTLVCEYLLLTGTACPNPPNPRPFRALLNQYWWKPVLVDKENVGSLNK